MIGIKQYRMNIIKLKPDQPKDVVIPEKIGRMFLIIHDTSSQPRFRKKIKEYYLTKEFFMIVYDVTNRQSFENVKDWLNEIIETK